MHLLIVSYLLFILYYVRIQIEGDNMNQEMCPKMEATLTLLSKKWIGLIVLSLLNGPKKFMELEKFIPGISSRLLSERLKELEKEGIVLKEVYAETPVRIEYDLTKKGKDLNNTYSSIGNWAEKWMK